MWTPLHEFEISLQVSIFQNSIFNMSFNISCRSDEGIAVTSFFFPVHSSWNWILGRSQKVMHLVLISILVPNNEETIHGTNDRWAVRQRESSRSPCCNMDQPTQGYKQKYIVRLLRRWSSCCLTLEVFLQNYLKWDWRR